jgi:rod shape-determining protein MreD
MNHELKYALTLFFGFGILTLLLQSMVAGLIEINIWRPDFVLAFLLLFSKRFGSSAGSSAGFFLGVIQDSLSPLPIGITMLPKSIAGYLAGKSNSFRLEGTSYYLLFIFIIFLHEAVTYFFLQYKLDLSYLFLVYSRVFPNTVYTMVILVVFNFFFGKYFTE